MKNIKRTLRQQLKDTLAKLTKIEHEHLSEELALKLYEEDDWQQATVIGITISRFPEPDTYRIIRRAWEDGKFVAVPKCYPATREMVFRRITDFTQLESVYSGLLEPIAGKTEVQDGAQMDLVIVPGLAFSLNGYRLGYGGGYYDRFLANYKGKTAALVLPQQLVTEIPRDEYDLPVERIITVGTEK